MLFRSGCREGTAPTTGETERLRGGSGRLCAMEGALERANEKGKCPAGGDRRSFPTRFVTVTLWACDNVASRLATMSARIKRLGGEFFFAIIIGNNNPPDLQMTWGLHLTTFALKSISPVQFLHGKASTVLISIMDSILATKGGIQ